MTAPPPPPPPKEPPRLRRGSPRPKRSGCRHRSVAQELRESGRRVVVGLGCGVGAAGAVCRLAGQVASLLGHPGGARLAGGLAQDLGTAAQALEAASRLISGSVLEADWTSASPTSPQERRPRREPPPKGGGL